MPISNYKPYNLNLRYSENPSASNLTKPYDLAITYVNEVVPSTQNLFPSGIYTQGAGTPAIKNKRDLISAATLGNQFSAGHTSTYNLTQYLKHRHPNQNDPARYGIAYAQGGVKVVKPSTFDATKIGVTLVINTKADQYAKPQGIIAPLIERPLVRPYIAHPKGIYSQAFGVQHRVGFIPTIKPIGLVQTQFGSSTTWYRVRRIDGINGFDSFDSGYARIFDPMRRLHIPSLITSAIFGDTAIKNTTAIIKANGVNDGAVSPWSIVTNANRFLGLKGTNYNIFGDTGIRNKTPSIFIEGIKAPDLNVPAIGYRQRTVKPSGFDRLALGKPLVIKTPELAPKGMLAYQSGQTTVWYKNRIINADGFDASRYSEKHTVWLRVRLLTPLSWVSNINGRVELTRNVRELIVSGYDSANYGRAWVSFSPRLISPQSIFQEYPTKHLVGRLQTIEPSGYIASLFGTRIIPVAQSLHPLGFAGKFGIATIDWYTRKLYPKGFFTGAEYQALRWGYTYVYNSVQYIKQVSDLTGGLAPPKWSDWQSVSNRNKVIGVTGFNSQRMGYTYIDNNARPLLPTGIFSPVIKGGMIARSVRYIKPSAMHPPYFGSYNSIYNDARIITHTGGPHSAYGRPLVESNRRYFRGIGRFESLEVSTPMISHAIRIIRVEERYSIAPPQINLPSIYNYVKYISVAGLESNQVGRPTAFIHFNIIAPKWRQLTAYGEGRLYNLTPEMRAYGHESMEFGVPATRTQWRNVTTMGDTATLFGKQHISDRTKTIGSQGWIDTKLSQKHVVIKTGAPLFSEQKIDLENYGIKVPDVSTRYLQVPEPGLNQNVLYVIQTKPNTLFGDTVVRANSIRLDDGSGIATRNFGDGNRIELKNRVITFSGDKDQVIQSAIAVGKPRMSPHTIYAPFEAPDQAKVNHPESVVNGLLPHYVDFWKSKGVGVALGHPKVENQNRRISARGSDSMAIGRQRAYLKAVVVNLDRHGITAGRAGVPKIPFTRQDLLFRDQSVSTLAVGSPSVISTWSNIDNAGGISMPAIPKHEVQLKHRWIKPLSFSALLMGAKKYEDSPYMWQGLRVGAHVPTKIGAGDTAIFGTAFISERVRGISVEGIDSFISEYDVDSFADRMKVHRGRPLPTPSDRLTTEGFNAYQSGAANIGHAQRFITPDGNSDQFRKGGYHA